MLGMNIRVRLYREILEQMYCSCYLFEFITHESPGMNAILIFILIFGFIFFIGKMTSMFYLLVV